MKVFDAHFHIIEPAYPIVSNNGYKPAKFTIDDYSNITQSLNISGGVIVSGSFQAFDQAYLTDSLKIMGADYCGVANISNDTSEEELIKLHKANIVAVRFNLYRGGSEDVKHIVTRSNKVWELLGWHTELYVDSRQLKDLKHILKAIPKFSIDHLGLSKEGLNELYYWVEKGAKVKATGFGRLDFNPIPAMKQIYSINPKALMFGTDLPSTRAPIPFSNNDLELIKNNFSTSALEEILYENAKNWYSSSLQQKSHFEEK